MASEKWCTFGGSKLAPLIEELRLEIPVDSEGQYDITSDPWYHGLIKSETLRRSVVYQMNHNAVCGSAGLERPRSAFFLASSTGVVIHIARITMSGQAKLHGDMRRYYDYCRANVFCRSGHIARPISHPNLLLAMFDAFCVTMDIHPTRQDLPILSAMVRARIMPITADGFPVLPLV